MNSKYLLLLFTLALFTQTFSQTWSESNIPESPSRYDDIFFLNENLGWAADGWGYNVFKTTDGGDSWEFQFNSDGEYLRNIEFLNADIGFLGTLTPNFYKTTDGGETWNVVNIPGVEAICGMSAAGETTIYGCGAYFQPAYIIKSTDSGESWTFMDMSAYADALIEVLFVDELNGYAGGSNENGGIVLKTTDGGMSWTEIYNSNIPGEMVWKLQILFSNPNVMFGAVESFEPLNGKLIKSTDSGQTWVSRDVPDPYIQGVGFVTENHGWMGGHNSGFLETFDAGETWTDTGFGASLNRFLIFDGNLAFCSGRSVYKYADALSVNDLILEKGEDLSIQMGPNPTDGILNALIDFKRNDHLVVTLFDESGRKIQQLLRETISNKGKRKYQFQLPEKPGIYYILFHYDLGYQSKKILKK